MTKDIESLELKLISEESFRIIHSVSKHPLGAYSIKTYQLDGNPEGFEVKEYEYFNTCGELIKKQKYISTHLPSLKELKEILGIHPEKIWLTHISRRTYKPLSLAEVNAMFPKKH
jgi:hypothetical protein